MDKTGFPSLFLDSKKRNKLLPFFSYRWHIFSINAILFKIQLLSENTDEKTPNHPVSMSAYVVPKHAFSS